MGPSGVGLLRTRRCCSKGAAAAAAQPGGKYICVVIAAVRICCLSLVLFLSVLLVWFWVETSVRDKEGC